VIGNACVHIPIDVFDVRSRLPFQLGKVVICVHIVSVVVVVVVVVVVFAVAVKLFYRNYLHRHSSVLTIAGPKTIAN